MTPFHNMALMCPYTVESDVDKHTLVFEQALQRLTPVYAPKPKL